MSIYRSSCIPAPLRTEVSVSDLQHLDVLRRILSLLNDPAADAGALAQLVDAMPVLAARLVARFPTASRGDPTTLSGIAFLGNRDLEAVLFELLCDLTDLRAEQAGIPAHGSVFPPLAPPPSR